MKFTCGSKHTDETKKKISKANSGRTAWNKGKKCPPTEKVLAHLKELHKKMIGRVVSESTRKRISEIHKGKVVSEETRKKQSENNVGMLGKQQTPETRRKISESRMGHVVTKETREKLRIQKLGKPLTEEHKQKIGNTLKGQRVGEKHPMWGKKRTEESKRKTSESLKKNPPMLGKKHTDETKNKLRVARSKQVFTEETRRKLSVASTGRKYPPRTQEAKNKMRDAKLGIYEGEGNPNWRGGIGKLPYPYQWKKTLKRSIRERDNYTCQICGCFGKYIHHIDYDKDNIDPDNLITLCLKDHGRTNGHRKDWEESLLAIVEERNYYLKEKTWKQKQ